MFAKIVRAFRPLDTTEMDTALAHAETVTKQVRVRARALRMDVSCGDPVEALRQFSAPVLSAIAARSPWDKAFKVDCSVPEDMQGLLRKL